MVKIKPSKEDEWAKMYEQRTMGMAKADLGKSVEERDRMPEKACGKCKHFLQNPYASTGSGTCETLRFGSDLSSNPPVFKLEGESPFQTYLTMDGAKCKHFEEMEFIDTDATECADPRYRRAQRQMKKALGQ